MGEDAHVSAHDARVRVAFVFDFAVSDARVDVDGRYAAWDEGVLVLVLLRIRFEFLSDADELFEHLSAFEEGEGFAELAEVGWHAHERMVPSAGFKGVVIRL